MKNEDNGFFAKGTPKNGMVETYIERFHGSVVKNYFDCSPHLQP